MDRTDFGYSGHRAQGCEKFLEIQGTFKSYRGDETVFTSAQRTGNDRIASWPTFLGVLDPDLQEKIRLDRRHGIKELNLQGSL